MHDSPIRRVHQRTLRRVWRTHFPSERTRSCRRSGTSTFRRSLSLLVPVLGPSPSRGPSLPVLAGGPPGTRTLNPPTRRVPAEDELAPIPITRASNPELASPTRRSGTRHNTHTERRISRRRRERRTAHTRSWRSTHGSPVMDAAQSLSSMSLWRCEAPRASPSGQEEASRSCISCARRGPASRPARPSARVGRGR